MATIAQPRRASDACKLLIIIPLMLAAIMSLLGALVWSHDVPSSLNKEEWSSFLRRIDAFLNDDDSALGILSVLFVLHALQVVVALPFLHVTKILYGYVFGVWQGFVLAFAWEFFIICCVVLTCWKMRAPADTAPVLLQLFVYAQQTRDENRLMYFLFLLDLSSIPLLTIISLVLFDAVTPQEFVLAHALACITTIRDTWLGNFISNSDGRAEHVGIASALFVVSTVLPTLITIIVLARVARIQTETETDIEMDSGSEASLCETEDMGASNVVV